MNHIQNHSRDHWLHLNSAASESWEKGIQSVVFRSCQPARRYSTKEESRCKCSESWRASDRKRSNSVIQTSSTLTESLQTSVGVITPDSICKHMLAESASQAYTHTHLFAKRDVLFQIKAVQIQGVSVEISFQTSHFRGKELWNRMLWISCSTDSSVSDLLKCC